MNNEFYIGWMTNAPKNLVRFSKKYLLVCLLVIVILGGILAVSQKKFGTGIFEFGELTEVKGIYFDKPVPCLKVVSQKDTWGNSSSMTVLLVGYGKHGAEGIIAAVQKEKNRSLDHKQVILKGTLIYNDGKTILQIDKNDDPVRYIGDEPATDLLAQKKELGMQTLRGEIVDPKCYFGVMKPGEGKPHRDCAVRCILGGIPPIFVVKNAAGEANYYLLVGPKGEKMNEAVKEVVSQPVSITARLVQYDDWVVMYVQDEKSIQRISYLKMQFGDSVLDCSASNGNAPNDGDN